MRRHGWISIGACGLAACAPQAPADDAASMDDAGSRVDAATGEGTWSRCCPGDHASIPGGMARGSGDTLECFCPAGFACNYAWGSCFRDAGVDAGTTDDAGFADAAAMDDAAIDALVITDDAGASP